MECKTTQDTPESQGNSLPPNNCIRYMAKEWDSENVNRMIDDLIKFKRNQKAGTIF